MHQFLVQVRVRLYFFKCCFYEYMYSRERNALSVLLDDASLQGIRISEKDKAMWVESLSMPNVPDSTIENAESLRMKYGVPKLKFINRVELRNTLSARNSLLDI